jgi:hypothetical protein
MEYPDCSVCHEQLTAQDVVVKAVLRYEDSLLTESCILHKGCAERFYSRTGCSVFYDFDLVEMMIQLKQILHKAKKSVAR